MYFNFRIYFRLLYVLFFKQKKLPEPHRRGILFCLMFFTLFPLVELFNTICFLLDDLFFPGYRKVKIAQPVFVIGSPRSGTTVLHRVMAKDEEQFFYFYTWEIIFPALTQKKVMALLGRLDRAFGEPIRQLINRIESKQFHDFERMHKVGLFLPEEDDKLFIHVLASTDLAWFFPFAQFDNFARLDIAVPAKEQEQMMKFYLECLKRQAYFKGGKQRLLSKNPFFSGKIENLLKYFPDCKIIYMVRNPLNVVPSALNMAREIARSTSGLEPGNDLEENAYEALKFFYTYPLERLAKMSEETYMAVNYEDLIHEPKRVIESIYKRLNIELTSAFQEVLIKEDARMKAHKSTHKYSLDDCQITRGQIISDLKGIFDRFGFDTQEPHNKCLDKIN